MPKGVYKRSPQHLLKMKAYGFQKNTVWANNRKGCKLSNEQKIKIGNASKGRIKSIEEREKMSKKLTGRIFSQKTKEKMSISAKIRIKRNGPLKYWLGKKNPNISKEKHWNWKGGVTPKNKRLRESSEYNFWRKSVLERDNYTCRLCHLVGGTWRKNLKKKVILHAHHIKPWALFPELRFVVDNGETLCSVCHRKFRHSNNVNSKDI